MADLTDYEITRLCARAMGLRYKTADESEDVHHGTIGLYDAGCNMWSGSYNPLRNDAQAMALVKKLCISIEWNGSEWGTSIYGSFGTVDKDLNRAICLCVARMEQAREGGR